MRVTNSMIVANTKSNINSNKVNVDKYNTQMTTQKKIEKASDNPVIAIRSLRMQTKLSHIDQYLDNNISDAESWLDVTDTALSNMVTILESIRSQCVAGATDTLKEEDRSTILEQLQQMADQVYSEGNSDYQGRTIFTGYRTTSMLTFQDDEDAESYNYNITQDFTYKDLEDQRYYYGMSDIDVDEANKTDCGVTVDAIGSVTYSRIRMAYGNTEAIGSVTYSVGNTTKTINPTCYASQAEWEAAKQKLEVDPDEAIYLKDTGELILGSNIVNELKTNKVDDISLSYDKYGFTADEPRPEYYYNCTDITDVNNKIEYLGAEQDQAIKFEISSGIYLEANTQARDVLDTSIGRDVTELINVVSMSISAHDTLDKIQNMMDSEQYSSDEDQAWLQTYYDAAEKQAALADDNMQKAFSQGITNFNSYLEKVNLAQTNVGCKMQRLSLTKTRVQNQRDTVEELKTNNDNRELSDIIIDYYAAYNAYTSSLTAAAKVNQQTLLNYI